ASRWLLEPGANVDALRDVNKEVVAECQELIDAWVRKAVDGKTTLLLTSDQTAVEKAGQVIRDVGLGQARNLYDLGHDAWRVPHGFENRQARRVRKASEELSFEGERLGEISREHVSRTSS